MAALTRPDLPPGPRRELADALHDLHHRAGWPSLRFLGRQMGCSPTTVSAVFTSPRLPSWGLLELLVEAMGGDVAEFRRLWLAAGASVATLPNGTGTRFAGRRRQLEMVRSHLESGTGLLLVTGEAGIGKTKLVDTASAVAEVIVARGAGLPLSRQVPFLPVTSVLRALHREMDLDGVVSACPAYVRAAAGSLLPELASQDPQPADVEGAARTRLFTAVQTLLDAVVQAQRVAVLIDDLHWADPDTLDLLEHLLVAGAGMPVVGVFRTEDPDVQESVMSWTTRMRRLPNVVTLDLGPMSRAETADQIELLPSPRPRTAADVDRIYARSLGRPLFTEQLAADTDGGLPPMLDDVLGQRVARLGPAEHKVVAALGVADRGLPVRVLEPVSGLAAELLMETLRELDRRRLLADNDDGSKGDDRVDTVALRHPLLAEAVRRRLVPGEPAELHGRLARALADGGEPAEVAGHWQAAGDSVEELGWRIRAARVAQTRVAAKEEARQWRRVLDLWVGGGDLDERHGVRRVDAEMALLDALEDSGQVEQSWMAVQPLLDRVDGLPAQVAAEVLYRAAYYGSLFVGGLEPAEQAARAVALLETLAPSRSLVRALEQYSNCQHRAGDVSGSWETDRRQIAVCRALGDDRELRRALVAHAANRGEWGWSSEAHELLDEAHRIVPSPPDPIGDVWLGTVETDHILKFGGSINELLDAGREALTAAETWGLTSYFAPSLRYNIALGWLRAGHVQEAAEIVDGLTEGPPTLETRGLHALRVALDTVRGRREDATARLAGTLAAAHETRRGAELNAVLTECQLWSGHADEAFERLTEVLENDQGVGSGDFEVIMAGECQALAVRAAADAAEAQFGRRAELRREVSKLLGHDDPTDIPSQGQNAYRHARTAELSRLANEPRPDLWAAAATEWDRINRPFEASYCRWRGAQAATETGRTELAQRMLRSAATHSSDHVPLTAAIERTATDVAASRAPAGQRNRR